MDYKFFYITLKRLIIFSFFLTSISYSQTLNETITSKSSEVMESYLSPALNPLAANINSAWLGRIPAPEMAGFNFSLGFYGMLSPIEKGEETFKSTGTYYLTEEQARTIVQEKTDDPVVQDQIIEQLVNIPFTVEINGTTITGTELNGMIISSYAEGGLNFEVDDPDIPFPVNVEIDESEKINIDLKGYINALKMLPYGAVQLNIGTLAGTEAIVRFIPQVKIDEEFGSAGMYGIGLLHNPQVWFPDKLPIELSLGFFAQNFNLGDRGKISAFSAGINLQKKFDLDWISIAPFVNARMEKAKFEITETKTFDTNYGSETVDLSLNIEGENKYRVGLGAVFSHSIIDLTFSYNFSHYNSIVGGISFNFNFFN